jgi:hypothetical protein
MRRIDLLKETMQAWARLDVAQRERFFAAFVAAAVRLESWSCARGSGVGSESRRLVAIDPARFTISDADIAHLLRTAGEAAAKPDETNGNPKANAPAGI